MLKSNNYQSLLYKIEEFTKKFYLNKIIKGSIWQIGIFLAFYLCIISTEYYGYFGVTAKTIIYYGFIISQLTLFYFLIFRYLLKFYKLGKTLDYESASKIIGEHFPDVKDKLLNTLQLNQQYNIHESSLLEASINQKIKDLKPIPFVAAIRLKENKKYAKYAIVPLSILLVLAFAAPSILKDGTNRIINHNQYFEEPAPFKFIVQNENLTASQGDDFRLNIKIEGKEVPKDVYLEDGANTYKVDKESLVNFVYQFHNLQNSKKFRLTAAGFYSKPFEIQVLKKPALVSFEVNLNYPNYTKKRDETLKNPSDLTFPAGTTLTWKLQTEFCNAIDFNLGKKTVTLRPNADNLFVHQERVLKSAIYGIAALNSPDARPERITYQLTSIADEYPSIDFEEMPDSINPKIIYFKGNIRDDYGFSGLRFHYKVKESDQKSRVGIVRNIPLRITETNLQENFFHFWNLNKSDINAGEVIDYYFSVSDNDGVTGPKTVKSVVKTFKSAIKDETIKQLEANSKSLSQKMQQAAKQAKQIQQEAQKINLELLSKSTLDFEDKKHAEELIKKQNQLEKLLKDIEREAKRNQLAQKEINPENQALIEKQKEIQELFEKVLDDKTKKLLENLQKLLDQNNKEQVRDNLQQIKADNKSIEKEFERMLELYKKLAFDQKLDNAANKLKELSQKQNELSKQTENKTTKDNESLQKQQELQMEFSEVKKDLRELEEKKKESNAEDFKNPESEQQEIEKNMKDAENMLEKKQKSAAKAQKSASEKMSELSKKLSDMQSGMQGEENKVNAQELKKLLKNVLKASFDQENILTSTKKTNINDAKFTDLGKQQKNLATNLKTIQDSLYSLSKRVPQIASAVNKEIQSINFNVNKTSEYISERKQAETLQSQQYVLTAVNNLALMLSDALEQLQNAMQNAKSGKGKPQPNMQQLSKMQQELNENMQKAKDGMEQQGGSKPGEKPGNFPGSKAFSQMAQQQQMIREAMENLNKEGFKLPGGLQKTIADMQQTETDLVYKRISQQVLLRQQQIQTKLLEAATAEREREQDTQKESTAAKDYALDYNLRWQQYIKQKNTDLEMIKTMSPTLNYFYKQKITHYYKNLNPSK